MRTRLKIGEQVQNLSREEGGETCQIPSVAQLSPTRKVQIIECEAKEGSAHLSGPSLVIGDEARQVPRVAQPSQPRKVQNSVSEPSLETEKGGVRQIPEWHSPAKPDKSGAASVRWGKD